MALSDVMTPFVWGSGGARKTPDQIAREREIAEALMAQGVDTSPVGHWLQGLARVAQAGAGVIRDRRATKAEQANATASQKRIAALLGGATGTAGAFPPAPSSGASAAAPMDYASERVAQAHGAAPVNLSGNKQAFIDALLPAALEASKRTGVDPRIIVAQAAQETGWGRSAPGNNYFGIKSHGKGGGQTFTTHEVINGQRVKMQDSFRQFASPADSVAGYADFLLENPRYKPLMAAQGLDAQLQALGASGYATDPNYAASVGAIARSIPLPEQPQQVASLDPSIGMASPAPQQTAGLFVGTPEELEASRQPTVPPLAPPLAPPREVRDAPVAQVAQSMTDQEALQLLGAQPAQTQAGGINPAIIEALSNPYASDQERNIAGILLRQQLEQSDPMRAIEMERAKLELDAMRNPRPRDLINAGDGRLYDPNSQQWIVAPGTGTMEAPTVQTFFDDKGQEYKAQWNRQTGEWEQVGGSKLPSGMSLRTNADGTVELVQGAGAGMKLTEQQGKDVGFYTRGLDADAQLAVLDTQLTSFGQQAAGALPLGVGNYLRNPEFRQAKQAADSFLTAILRKDTGAAVTDKEFEIYGPMFLPVPGDDPATIEQKRRARGVALLAIRSGLGTAEAIGEANRIALGRDAQTLAPKSDRSGAKAPVVIDGYTIEEVE